MSKRNAMGDNPFRPSSTLNDRAALQSIVAVLSKRLMDATGAAEVRITAADSLELEGQYLEESYDVQADALVLELKEAE